MISLAGKAALITGGSRGIGAATVKLLARAGADVVFNYHRNRDAARQVEQEARKHGTRVESLQADLGRMADAKKLVGYAVERLGRLDVLVANAGIWNRTETPIERLSEREWDAMVRVNLKSVYSVTHFAAAHMIAQRSGRIIAVSSTAGQRGEAFHAHQLRRAWLGGDRYDPGDTPKQGGMEIRRRADSPGPRSRPRRDCRADPISCLRPCDLYYG